MINAITIIKKKQGLTYEKFQNYWKNEHAEIVTRSPLVGTYVQSHPIYNDELTFEDTIDGIAEIWFEDTNAMRSLAKERIAFVSSNHISAIPSIVSSKVNSSL